MNYVQQGVFSDVNQFGLSDTHIFNPRLVNEATFSYLTSRSGGGALTQIAPRDQGVNVDVGNDGRGMSYSVSGSINLNYPGVNAQDYVSWQFKDTMTYNAGNHTLKWGYEFIRPIFEFNLALTRSASFTGTRTGNAIADFMIGAFDNSTIEFGIADHSPSTVKHQAFVADSWKIHPRLTLELRSSLRAVRPVRSEGRPAHDLGAGRAIDGRARRAARHPVPRRSGPAVASHEQRPEQLRAAPRRRVGRRAATRRPSFAAATASSISRSTARRRTRPKAPWRGTTQLRQGRIEDPFGSLGQTEPPPAVAGPIRLLADLGVPRTAVHAVSAADPDRLHGSEPEDQLHAALQRVAAAPADANISRSKRPTSARSAASWSATTTSTRRRTSTRRSRDSRRRCRTSSSGCRSAQASSARSRACSATSSAAPTTACSCGSSAASRARFSFSGSYALSKNLTNQPENTTGLISSIPNPFDLDSLVGAVVPRSPARRRRVLGLEPAVHVAQRVLGALLNGWTITGFHRIQSGSPLVFTMGTDVAQNGILQPNGQYALLVPGATADDVRRDHANTADMLAAYFNTAAFVPLANVPRGIYGDATPRTDLRSRRRRPPISRSCAMSTSAAASRLQLRARVVQPVQPGELQQPEHERFRPGSFGRITGAGSGRVIQLAAKVIW